MQRTTSSLRFDNTNNDTDGNHAGANIPHTAIQYGDSENSEWKAYLQRTESIGALAGYMQMRSRAHTPVSPQNGADRKVDVDREVIANMSPKGKFSRQESFGDQKILFRYYMHVCMYMNICSYISPFICSSIAIKNLSTC